MGMERGEGGSRYFMEDLRTANHLETTYYVTHQKQVADFFWFRKSGLRLNLGLENINLVSSFEEGCEGQDWWQEWSGAEKGSDDNEFLKERNGICRFIYF